MERLNDYPDLKGIETVLDHLLATLSADRLNDYPDLKGIETAA